MRDFLQRFTTLFQPALTAAVLVLAVGGIAGPMTVFADARSSESEQTAPADERSEEATASSRVDHQRQAKLDQRRAGIILELPSPVHLGHTQKSVFFMPSGHRLANGLLAPITC